MEIDLEELKRLAKLRVEHPVVDVFSACTCHHCEWNRKAQPQIPALIERLERAEADNQQLRQSLEFWRLEIVQNDQLKRRVENLEAELAALREQVRWHFAPEEKPTARGTYVVLRADQEPDIDEWVFFPFREQGGEWGWETMEEPDGWLGPLPEVKE